MTSKDYWINRALQREQETYDSTTSAIHRLHAIYAYSAERLAKVAKNIFTNYMKSSGMADEKKAKELLSVQETTEVLKKLRDEYSKTGSLDALAKINAPTYGYRISRVQAMRQAIDAEIQNLAEAETKVGVPHLVKSYDDTYYKTIYDIEKDNGSIKFDHLSDRTIQQAIENKWKGKNYSECVWKNTHVLAKEAGKIIDEGVTSGTSITNMSAQIEDLFQVAYYAAERLVRTEVSRMRNDATLQGYKAMGVDWYTWLGALDARTCLKCGALDGKHFKVDEAQTGLNLPPRHPNCRCTTIAYYPDEEIKGTRIARNPETSKSYKVAADVDYLEWRKQVGVEELEKALKYYRKNKKWARK